ncbi:MAG TPA: hypothetical protein VNO26_03365 [Candidatus Limnocylindria bacterium]|nr:hypothetical protein [Candidatus Limnocylindria bacterium]
MGPSDDLLGGALRLPVKPGKPRKSKLELRANRPPSAVTPGRGPGSADDPTLHGARLLVFASRGNGAIKKVTIVRGRTVTAKGTGEGLGLQLGEVDPSPVGGILEIGEHRYCMEFTARVFKPARRLSAPKSPPRPPVGSYRAGPEGTVLS